MNGTINKLTLPGGSLGDNYYIYSQDQLSYFLKINKGNKMLITFEVQDDDDRKRQLRYYFAVIIPEWKKALFKKGVIKSNSDVDVYLRSLSPILENISLSDLNFDELVQFLDHVRSVSLQDVNLVLEDPRCI